MRYANAHDTGPSPDSRRVDALVLTAATTRSVAGPPDIPRSLRIALYALLIVAGATSLPMIGKYGPLPTTGLLDIWLAIFSLVCIARGRTQLWGLFILILGYALTRLVPALYIGAPITDFLQAYRWVFYMIVLALGVGRYWGPIAPLVKVAWALIGMALAKAALTYFLAGDGERPGLLIENNFELALFCGLAVVLYNRLGRGKPVMIVMLGALTLLAGSRSGVFAYLVFVLFAVSQIRATRSNLFLRFLLFCAAPGLAVLPIVIFSDRAETVRIDRLNFLDVFFYETQHWNLANWLFGTVPITPLTDGCTRLAFYKSLFSSTGDGTCYSVIMHAFVLRVVFDAGIAGAILVFSVIWYTMRKSRASIPVSLAVVGIAVTNSLSVSGPNNPYVMLPVLIGVLTTSSAVTAVTQADAQQRHNIQNAIPSHERN